jgi:hypothetical protein
LQDLTPAPLKITENPDVAHISTSYAERANLTMRMGMRRFTRLTNGFSKKVANHKAAIALHFMHYNFARAHKTPRVTPAMEAGVPITSGLWKRLQILTRNHTFLLTLFRLTGLDVNLYLKQQKRV